MFTLKSSSYFTDHNLLKRMPQELLFRLLSPYAYFFKEHEVELPTEWKEGVVLPIDAICVSLMNVKSGDNSNELVEELTMLSTLIHGKELIDKTLDVLVAKHFSHVSELQRIERETDADYIIKLWLNKGMRVFLEDLVPWIQAKTAKTFAEFPLRESLCPDLDELAKKEVVTEDDKKNALEKLGLPGLEKNIRAGMTAARERIGAHYKSKGYTDYCEIKFYPNEDNNEIVFIVDHSGKQQRVNTLSNEKQKDVTSFIPLLNDVIVLMPERALLRVSTKMAWSESLYREVFGLMLLNDQYAFEIRELYHFEPLFNRAPAAAFPLTGFHGIIRAVELKVISYYESDLNIGNFLRTDNQSGLMRAAYLQDGAPTTTQRVVLELKMKNRSASRPVTVTLQKGKGKGLGCSVDIFYPVVHKWISNLGFRYGLANTKTLRLLDAAEKDKDAVLNWKNVSKLLQQDTVSINYLEKVCGARVRMFLDKYLDEAPGNQMAKVWYEREGEVYNILERNDTYSIVNPDNMLEVIGEIDDVEDIVLRTIKRRELFKDVYTALSHNMRRTPDSVGNFLFGGSFLNSKGVSVWLFFPTSNNDLQHLELLKGNRHRSGQCCIVLPRDKWNMSDDWFQKVYLDEIIEIDEAGQLRAKDELVDLVEDRSSSGQDGPPYRKWHLHFPESRDWGHIDMKFGYDSETLHTTLHVTYGAGEHAPQANLIHSDITAFTKQSESHGWKKEFLLLLQIANQMTTRGYFLRGDSRMGTQLNRLADILSEYFCLDGLFYEEVPHQEGAKKRYRTKFRVSIAPSLKELLNNIHD